MSIRPFKKEDLEECAQLLIRSYNNPPWRYQWDMPAAKQYLAEYIEVKQFVGFVLHHEGDLAGALFAHTKTWWTSHQLYVDELFVSSDKQRKGIGKVLLLEAERYGRENGFPTIFLMTNKFMPAYSFYLKNDYLCAEHFVFLFKQV